jgi:hypothetical protein
MFNLPYSLRRFIPLRWQKTSRDEPPSLVMLQRTPHRFTIEELQNAAQRAWHRSFKSEDKTSQHFVIQNAKFTLLKVGPHIINFFYYPKPYVDNPAGNVDWLPHPRQREAWIQHHGCFAADYFSEGKSVELAYAVAAQLVLELVDENCTGVYLPRDQALVPNGEPLQEELHRLASRCDTGIKKNVISRQMYSSR